MTDFKVSFETTHHIRDHCLCLASQRAARALARRFDEALRPAGISSGQFSLMNALNRPKPASIGSVAALLAMDRTTLTANLKPLERRGLLTTTVDPDDRRGRLLTLTEAGLAVLAAATPIWRKTHTEIDRALGERDADGLRDGLRVLSSGGLSRFRAMSDGRLEGSARPKTEAKKRLKLTKRPGLPTIR